MKKWMLSLLVCCVAWQVNAADSDKGQELEWLTDLPKALAKAKQENKVAMLNFTGSDWCGWCIKLKKEVFSKPEFAKYAKENLVLVEVDFPRRKKLSPAQTKANEALSQKYDIEGFPTIGLLSGDGKLLGKTGYASSPQVFIAELEKLKKKS